MDRQQQEALEHIVVEYQNALLRFAFFRIGSLSDAQDIVQNVFIRMIRETKNLSRIVNLKAYLFRCTANRCCDHLKQKRASRLAPLESAEIRPADQQEYELIGEYERVEKLMLSIPAEQAEVIRMKTINNLSFVEIAEILDLPVTTVKSRFQYGIDKLRSKIN